MVNWNSKLDNFGRNLVDALGGDPSWLSTETNIVIEALRSKITTEIDEDGNEHSYPQSFVQRFSDMKGFNKSSVSRAVVACQMTIFDANDGPEMDGDRKAMRRHWYSWWKTTFAQPFSEQLGEDVQSERWGINWFAMLSTTYSHYVDKLDVTYHDLWVRDASRMMKDFYAKLFADCDIVVCIEKDSAFEDFTIAAQAIGATAIYSGKGKSSKGAIEKLLQTAFNWQPEWPLDPFTAENPLIVLVVSDFDFDGHAVIDPTFSEQISRYTNHVVSQRVGIVPQQFVDVTGRTWEDAVETNDAYRLKLKNDGYLRWASENALFWHECLECGHPFVGQGADWQDKNGRKHYSFIKCPLCSGLTTIKVIDKNSDARGFEVEALYTRQYYGLIVDALLKVLDFDYLLSKMRDECVANASQAVEPIVNDILTANESYQRLLEEFERLEKVKQEVENDIREELLKTATPNISAFRHLQDNPIPDDFREYVAGVSGYVTPWRPFSQTLRTDALTELVRNRQSMRIGEMEKEVIW